MLTFNARETFPYWRRYVAEFVMFDPDRSHIHIHCGENFPSLLIQSGRFYTGDGKPTTLQELPEFVVTVVGMLSAETKTMHGIAGVV